MTTVRKRNVADNTPPLGRHRTAERLVGVVTTMLLLATAAQAQPVHHIYHDSLPPGAIGAFQIQRGGARAGYFQPVEITLPQGASVSFVVDDRFERNRAVVNRVGMLVGPVYRLKVTDIPLAEGQEVFPTIEIIDRLCPPPGMQWKFPVPVEITQEELHMALEGKHVMRVIYVEDPQLAIPASYVGEEQPWFDVGDEGDAVQTADILGRPIAILRMGGRVPMNPTKLSRDFTFGSPPFVRVTAKDDAKVDEYESALKKALEPDAHDAELMARLLRARERKQVLDGETR